MLNVIDSPNDVISIMMRLKYSNNEIKTVHKYVSIVNDWNVYIKDEHIDKWSRKQQYICKTKESAFEAFHKAISESEFFRDNDNFEIDDVRLIADSDPNGDGDYYEYIKVVKMPVFK